MEMYALLVIGKIKSNSPSLVLIEKKGNMIPKFICWLFGHNFCYTGKDNRKYKWTFCPRCGKTL